MIHIERHKTPKSMLLESLDELLFAADYCLKYRKEDKDLWPHPHAIGGAVGIPAAIMLFTVVDSLGSYYRKNGKSPLIIPIDGISKSIETDGYHHFFILNSKYFGLSLTEKDIQNIYVMGRCKLMHNAILGKEITIRVSGWPFLEVNDRRGKGRFVINLRSFCDACCSAVNMFKDRIDDIVPHSPIGKNFSVKD